VGFDPRRLRHGEWIAGGGAVVLAVALFLLPWYGLKSPFAPTAASLGRPTSFTGWASLSHVRWLVLATIVLGLTLALLQGVRRSPAWPVTFSVIETVFALLCSLALIYRVLINIPGNDSLLERRAGAYIGLAAALAMFYGGYASMRQEGLSERDANTDIATVSLAAGIPDTAADS
jgi:NO-binding membrane sensor protein with MHYT domain